jgi:predicted histidine transporter YuiF (NhaC family)
MNRVFQQSYHVPGTLTANIVISFTVPFDCQLVHVSACASNDSDATLIVGTSADTNGYIEAAVIGDSGVPAEFEGIADFDGALADGQYPHIVDGTVVVATLDYDGAAGTAADDFTLVLTFTEG